MTTPPESALAAVLAEHEHEYERRCYPAHACSCGEWDGAFDDDGGPDDGQNDNADAYRLHVAAAILAATDARAEADGLTEAERVQIAAAERLGLHETFVAVERILTARTVRIAHLEAALATAEAKLGAVEAWARTWIGPHYDTAPAAPRVAALRAALTTTQPAEENPREV